MHNIMPPAHTHTPRPPEVRDRGARNLLWVVITLTVINLAMTFYVFSVIHDTVQALQHLRDTFNQLGQLSQ